MNKVSCPSFQILRNLLLLTKLEEKEKDSEEACDDVGLQLPGKVRVPRGQLGEVRALRSP